ncbi:hypothetical protein [uncultured Polaribacter sp.]|uniref:hypothetical protein n=1 Tax=uncultured Polaribacter sp. TaxID=174711 RepID=UPI00259AF2DA|nr:hypothetical protein [uncultured Polaribacter sp.]
MEFVLTNDYSYVDNNRNFKWREFCKDKFNNIEIKNGLYILFHDNKGVYVLKHYEPNNDKSLNLQKHNTIIEPDKELDYDSLEIGINEHSLISSGFVKNEDNYYGMNYAKNYNKPEVIRHKLDNENTINNFYQYGIYDWLITDAIMEDMGKEQYDTKKEYEEKIGELQKELADAKHEVSKKEESVLMQIKKNGDIVNKIKALATLANNFFSKNSKIEQINFVLEKIGKEGYEYISSINVTKPQENNLIKPENFNINEINIPDENIDIEPFTKYAMVSTICTLYNNALDDQKIYNILCKKMKKLNDEYHCTEINIAGDNLSDALKKIKVLYTGLTKITEEYAKSFDEYLQKQVDDISEQLGNERVIDLNSSIATLKSELSQLESTLNEKRQELSDLNNMKDVVQELSSNKQKLSEEIRLLELKLIEKQNTNIIEDGKYEGLKNQLTGILKREIVVDGVDDDLSDKKIIDYINNEFMLRYDMLTSIEQLLKKTLVHFSEGVELNTTINNLVDKKNTVILKEGFQLYLKKINDNLFNNTFTIFGLPRFKDAKKILAQFNYKTDEEITEAIKSISSVLNSGLKYFLAINPNFYQDDNFSANSIWSNFGLEFQERNDLLPFLFIDSRYEHWVNFSSYSQEWDKGVYKMSKIIEFYKNTYKINSPSLILGMYSNIFDQKKGTLQFENEISEVLHIADFIRIYEFVQNSNDSNKGYYMPVLKAVFTNYLNGIEKNVWYKDGSTKISNINEKINTKTENSGVKSGYGGIIEKLQKINDTKIITMVKINNYSDNLQNWNISYFPFTNESNFLKLFVHNNNNKNTDDVNKNFEFLDTDNNNHREYTFGSFSKLFKPNQISVANKQNLSDDDDDDIKELMESSQTETIKSQIGSKKDVFIFGYGASGAGKTAMLVYNNNKKTPGYCVSLCKKIIEDFYVHDQTTKRENIINEFKFDIVITEYDVDHNDKKNKPNELFKDECNLNSLPGILKTYVTNPSSGHRNIKPTRNNKESSRSHVLIQFKFPENKDLKQNYKEGLGSLYVADLAGVESAFNKQDARTITETMALTNFDTVEFKKYKHDTNTEKIEIQGNETDIEKLLDSLNSEISDNKYDLIEDKNKNKKYINTKIVYDNEIKYILTTEKSYASVKKESNYYINYDDNIVVKKTKMNRFFEKISDNRDRITTSFRTEKNEIDLEFSLLIAFFDTYKKQFNDWRIQEEKKITSTYPNHKIYSEYSVFVSKPGQHPTNRTINALRTDLDPCWVYLPDKTSNLVKGIYFCHNQTETVNIKGSNMIETKKSKDNRIEKLKNIINKFLKFLKFFIDTILKEKLHFDTILNEKVALFDYNGKKYSITSDGKIYECEKVTIPLDTSNSVKKVDDLVDDLIKLGINEIDDFINKYVDNDDKNLPHKVYKAIQNGIENNSIYDYSTKYKKEKEINKKKEDINKKLLYTIEQIECRSKEGQFINDELKNLREDMLSAIYYKSDESLFTCPNVEPTCLSTLCNTENNKLCYMMKCKNQTYSYTHSNMMSTIIGQNIDKLKSTTIVVFTVFNISQKTSQKNLEQDYNLTTDDPIQKKQKYYTESSIYIDLNNLKEAHKNYNEDKKKNRNKLNEELEKLNKFITTNEHSSLEVLKIGDLPDMLNTAQQMNNLSDKDLNAIYELIDTHNASTPLGTLIFTDNIAKFGTFDSVCYSKISTLINDDNYEFAIDINNTIKDDLKNLN